MLKQIKKTKITKDRTCEVTLIEILDDKTTRVHPGVKCGQIVHEDMLNAFAKLKFHLVKTTEMDGGEMKLEEFDPATNLVDFKVTGFSLGGGLGKEGVVLMGNKTLETGIVWNFPSPFVKYADYQYPDLKVCVDECVRETEKYMFEGKQALKQMTIADEKAANETKKK